jgi:PAS domain S-box-containing protein
MDKTTIDSELDVLLHRIDHLQEQLSTQNSYIKFFNSISDFLFITDQDGIVLLFNDAVRDILGYMDEDLIGQNLLMLHPEDMRLQAVENLKAILDGKLAYCPLDIISKDGKRISVESTVTMGKIDDQTVMFGISRDVSHTKNMEQMVSDADTKFRKIFDISSAAMSISERETGKFISVNKNFEILTGYSAEEVIGETSKSLSLFVDFTQRNQAKDVAMQDGSLFNAEIKYRRKDGKVSTGLFSVTMFDADKSTLLTTAIDIQPIVDNRENLEQIVAQKTLELKNNNDRLTAVINGSQAGLWDWNIPTGELIINERWAEIIGYTLEELAPVTINTWKSICYPDDLLISEQKINDHFQKKVGYYECEVRLRHKNGRWIWVLDRGQVLEWDKMGNPVRMCGTHIDYSQRKEAEILLSNRNRIEELVTKISIEFIKSSSENLDDLINMALRTIGEFAVIDRSYVFIINTDATTMDNTHEWCAEGVAPQIIYLKELPLEIFPWWMNILSQYKPIYIPFVSELPPEASAEKEILEQQDILSVLVLPIYTHKRLIGFIGFDSVSMHKFWLEEDIRLLEQVSFVIANAIVNKEAQEEIINAKLKAEESDRTKSQFLANINHEIRTPFSIINGFLDLIPSSEISNKYRDYLIYARSSAKLLNQIIEKMFEFKHMEQVSVIIQRNEINLRQILDLMKQSYSMYLDNKKILFDIDLSDRQNWHIITDYKLIFQIIVELLSNAVKFTEQGIITVRVKISPDDPHVLQLFIADTGIGIPEENLSDIFIPFAQVDSSFTRKYNGVGMGLALVKKNVDLLGGTIKINSAVGQGTSVYLEIPVELPPVEAAFRSILNIETDMTKRILIVEDSTLLQKLMCELLRNDGFAVTSAFNGQEGVASFETDKPDLILMDVQMPIMNGLQATMQIRNLEQGTTDHIPIIAVTAHATPHDHDLCLESGMDDVVFKPFQVSLLLSKIRYYLKMDIEDDCSSIDMPNTMI